MEMEDLYGKVLPDKWEQNAPCFQSFVLQDWKAIWDRFLDGEKKELVEEHWLQQEMDIWGHLTQGIYRWKYWPNFNLFLQLCISPVSWRSTN